MIKDRVASIKKEIREKEEAAFQRALEILDKEFDHFILEELKDSGVVRAGYIGIASNHLFAQLNIEARHLSRKGFTRVFKYIKSYCKREGLRVKTINREAKFFYVEVVFIEYKPLVSRIKNRLALFITRYLLAN